MAIKLHILNQSMGQKNSQRILENILRQMKMKTRHTKTYGCCDTVHRDKFIVVNKYIKSEERYQVNNITLHLSKLKKDELNSILAEGMK